MNAVTEKAKSELEKLFEATGQLLKSKRGAKTRYEILPKAGKRDIRAYRTKQGCLVETRTFAYPQGDKSVKYHEKVSLSCDADELSLVTG